MLYMLYAVYCMPYAVQLYTVCRILRYRLAMVRVPHAMLYTVFCMLYTVCCMLYTVCCMLYYSQKSCSLLNACICAHFWCVYSLKELQMYGA